MRILGLLLVTTVSLASFGHHQAAFGRAAPSSPPGGDHIPRGGLPPVPKTDITSSDKTGIAVNNNEAVRAISEHGESNRIIAEHLRNYFGRQLQQQSEQETTTTAVQTRAVLSGMSGQDVNAAIKAKEQNAGNIAARMSGVPDKVCTSISATQSTALVETGAEAAIDRYLDTALRRNSMMAGELSEFGLIDYQRKLFQELTQFCSPESWGGDAEYCNGDGTAHVSLGTLLREISIPEGDPVNGYLNALEQLLYTRIPISINPDLLENPNTEVMNTMVEAERLRAEMSIGQTLFSTLRGNREKIPGVSASNSLIERLRENGWGRDDIDRWLSGGMSRNAMYHALTVGSFGTPFMLQELVGNEEGIGVIIAREMMLNNVLQYHQYRLLEAIALATATTNVMNRDDAIEDLNRRISALNTR